MLALRLPPDIEKRLAALAKKTGRTKSFYAREAILIHLDDIEDAYLAQKALEEGGPTVSLKELMREFDVEEEIEAG
jgi:RHH-type rel operon transcriptional repressor/antitoxin RelB